MPFGHGSAPHRLTEDTRYPFYLRETSTENAMQRSARICGPPRRLSGAQGRDWRNARPRCARTRGSDAEWPGSGAIRSWQGKDVPDRRPVARVLKTHEKMLREQHMRPGPPSPPAGRVSTGRVERIIAREGPHRPPQFWTGRKLEGTQTACTWRDWCGGVRERGDAESGPGRRLTRIIHEGRTSGAACRSGTRKSSDATRFPTRNSCEFCYAQ